MEEKRIIEEKRIMGLRLKTWVISTLIVLGVLCIIFMIIPFLLATFVPLSLPEGQDYTYLVSFIDGAALLVGIVGTVASGMSIIMTFMDRSRFNQERAQTDKLVLSVEVLRNKLDTVNTFVQKTFDQNEQLAGALYASKIIATKPYISVSSESSRKDSSYNWQCQNKAGEIDE